MRRLTDPSYLAFPFRIEAGAPKMSRRNGHVREQIEQVLFTNPPERVFRPEFGAGVRAVIFEPNSSPLWETTRTRIISSLTEALQGEVDPATLDVEVQGAGAELLIVIRYALAAIGKQEEHRISLGEKGYG